MSNLPSVKSSKLLSALSRHGFSIVRQRGSHRFLRHPDGRTLVIAFHDRETVGPRMIARVIKDAGISVEEFLDLL